MNRAQALRVLGLQGGGPGGVDDHVDGHVGDDIDDDTIRWAFHRQLRQFREARKAATEPEMQQRLDRALKATVLARRELLGPVGSARTEPRSTAERPRGARRPRRRSRSARSWPPMALAGGLLAATVFAGVLFLRADDAAEAPVPPPARVAALESESESELEPELEPGSEAVPLTEPPPRIQAPAVAAPSIAARDEAALVRAWLDQARLMLARSWRAGNELRVPARTDSAPLQSIALPRGWRFLPQRRGAVALVDDKDRWLLLVPVVEREQTSWVCAGADPFAGCLQVDDRRLEDAVRAGTADPRALADALGLQAPELAARLRRAEQADPVDAPTEGAGVSAPSEAAETGSIEGGAAAAAPEAAPSVVRRGDGPELFLQAEAALAAGDVDAARVAFEGAEAAFAAAGDAPEQARVLDRLTRLDARDLAQDPSVAAGWMLRCRRVRDAVDVPIACPGPTDVAVGLERALRQAGGVLEDPLWARVRWWYEQGVADQEGYSARGLARLLALGLGGPQDAEAALVLMESAARDWTDFSEADAAATSAQFSVIWGEGWGVTPNAVEASWWASQGARLGHVGSALRLAGAFAIGSGTMRNLDRARQLVAVYREFTPLFEVAFYRNVGQRLTEGTDADVEADPEAGRAWFRRAFELCEALVEAGSAPARVELAGMYFHGEGAPKNAARAAELYAQELEAAPVKAGNMLAWIRATHPDPALRDGAAALELAMRVVALAPDPDFLDTLAAAHAEVGDFESAVRVQREALALLARQADPGLIGRDIADRRERLVQRLDGYLEGRPWRDP